MFLSRLRVANFRGLQHLELKLDSTTVLIGENNSGKTSLLAALDRLLGIDAEGDAFGFQPADFHVAGERHTDASTPPIELEVELCERSLGEWSGDGEQRLAGAMRSGPDGIRQIVLRVVASKSQAGAPPAIHVDHCFLDAQGTPISPRPDAALLGELRRKSPLILIGTDRYFRHPHGRGERTATPLPSGQAREATARHELELQVDRVYRTLCDSRVLPADELRAGLAAVGQWIAQIERGASRTERRPRLLGDLVEAPVRLTLGSGPRLEAQLQGAGAQSIGLLVLLGALLEARAHERLDRDAQPLVAIEEPEAHLHPLMLMSIWSLIDGLPAQKLITTNSAELLAAVPLRAVRRLAPRRGASQLFGLSEGSLDVEELRRVTYHVRVKRGGVFFARCWLLVEGETEFWLLPELARLCGFDLAGEGITCVEFAQCGPVPLVKVANDLGIAWQLLVDGDTSGKRYAESVREHLGLSEECENVTILKERDIEHCLWRHGYADVYRTAAGRRTGEEHAQGGKRGERPARVIERAVRAKSKPYLALEAIRAAGAAGAPGVPEPLRAVIEAVVRRARESGR